MADTCGAACYMKDDGAETDMTHTRMAGADVVESAAVALLGVGSISHIQRRGKASLTLLTTALVNRVVLRTEGVVGSSA